MHVPVAIIGAGPSGSLLAWILRQRGIESIVFENRSQAYVEGRIRAGVMEKNAVDLMIHAGIGDRLQKECMYQRGVEVGINNSHHFIDFEKLIGVGVTVYGQSEVTKDLLGALSNAGHNVLYETPVTGVSDHLGEEVTITYEEGGVEKTMTADFVVGADGYHGASRKSLPAGGIKMHENSYPLGWLGIMVKAPQSKPVAFFTYHDRGFALLSMRTPEVQRMYLQVSNDENLDEWSDDRIWDELDTRMGTEGWSLTRGEIFQKDLAPLRSFFCEEQRYGRLFLAGDAAHIVPPTGAKGLNSAFADVSVLSAGLIQHYTRNDSSILDQYSRLAVERNVQTQRFSWANTAKYHVFPGSNSFERRMQQAELEYLVTDEIAQTSYAKQHTGLPFAYWPEL
ncbi:4-hydroxybenzoate 3-monooxygenase [Tropicibacter sp. Alg240-R139]|uniref:4-hydroxybenzoate 3-monooxygenase n=1 Tax=Tropicibacter sp. Alg240-R139 TaxID=2305991 RepID=UPI0013DFE57B|nr:4-hydroxybenzoate 3-monooxygenase [Tropicibacter sp. Alg240-R139]